MPSARSVGRRRIVVHAFSLVALATCVTGLRSQLIPQLTTFDVPEAGSGAGQGTTPTAINANGDVTGSFRDPNGVNHGFLRYASGDIVTFDAPGSTGTVANAVNYADTVVGTFTDVNFYFHGFQRTSDGTITTFDAPGYIGSPSNGTDLVAINSAGVILGYFNDPGVLKGFLLQTDGTYEFLSGPGTGPSLGVAINAYSGVAGSYEAPNGNGLGYIRTAMGTAYDFDVDGSLRVEATAINDTGSTVGIYYTGSSYLGFLRLASGQTTTIAVPAGLGTSPTGINYQGTIVGWYSTGTYYGSFLVLPAGAMTTFRVPNAFTTKAVGVSNSNAITGYFCVQSDCTNTTSSGFIFVP